MSWKVDLRRLWKPGAYKLTSAIIAMATAAIVGGSLLRADVPPVATGSWVASGPFAEIPSGAASAILPDGRVVVAGGQFADGSLNGGVALYDPATGEWTLAGALIEPRTGLAATALADGRVVFAGGRDAAGVTASIEVFDPQAGSSVEAGQMMLLRADAAAATLPDGRVLIAGGTDGSGPLAAAELFDPATNASQFTASLSVGRSGLSATTLLDGHVLVAGGNDGQHDLSIAEIYDPELGIFWETEWMHTARSRHAAIRLPGSNTVLVAGGVSNGVALKSAEQYAHWGQLWLAYEPLMSVARVGAIAAPTARPGVVMIGGGGSADGEFYGFATVGTDKNDYAPYETVTISGSGWQPGETVHLRVSEDSDSHYDWEFEAIADELGNIVNREFYPRNDDVYHHMGMRFYATAHGIASEAETTFTDGGTLAIEFAGDGSGSVHGEGAGQGAWDCSSNCTAATYTSNGNVTLTAAPAADSTFVSWSTNVVCDPSKGCTVKMDKNQTVTATFRKTVTKQPSSTTVTVSNAIYDGTPHGGTALATGPNGLNQPLTVTYEGRNGTVYGPSTTAPTNAGDYVGSASFAETANYFSSADSKNFSIAKATATLALGGLARTYDGTPKAATVTTSPAGLNVVTITYDGVTTAPTNVKSGGYAVVASLDNPNYQASNATGTLVIERATPVLSWSTPDPITYGALLGATQLSASASVPGTLTYTPGAGTKLNAGTQQLSVTFTPTDALNYNGAEKSVSITVLKATPVITWDAPADITYGTLLGPAQLNATADAAGDLVYTPAAGTKLNAGTHQLSVTFTPTDALNYNGAEKSISITVLKATPVITWDAPADITYGTLLGPAQLNATADVAGDFVYTPAAGTKLNAGYRDLSVAFMPTDQSNYNGAEKTVGIEVLKATPVITWDAPADITYGTPLSAVQLNALASVDGEFVYTPALGIVLDAGQQQVLSVKFTPTDTANYNEVASTTVKINVGKATPQVNVTGGTFTYDANPHAATGSATGVNGVSLTPVSVAYYQGEDQLGGAPVDAGTYSAVAHFAGNSNYEAAESTPVAIIITPATPVVTATGGTFTYDGSGHPGSGSAHGVNDAEVGPVTLSYARNGAPIVGIPTNAGAYTVTAHFGGNNNYMAGDSTPAAIIINQAQPVVTWLNPSDIVYGTLLDTAQLNATANVGGTFVYTPAAGTKLNAGLAQVLSVTFTPADAVNYTTATKTVSLNVNKATPTVSVTWVGGPFTGSAFYAGGSVKGVGSPAEPLGQPTYAYYAGSSVADGTYLGSAAPVNVGTYTVRASFAGNDNYRPASADATITIGAWSLKGFYEPVGEASSIISAPGIIPAVSGTTVWNSIKGGQTVPLKFNIYRAVGGAQITTVADAFSGPGFSVYQLSTCSASSTEDTITGDLSTGATDLRWDGTQFIQNWKTPKVAGADLCYRAVVTAKDGSTISAFFKVKK